ncbi:MAG: FAD-binding oxidoreductase, partial [Methylotenera sp.]
LYFPLVWHSVVLMDFNYWASPLGIVMGALMLIGTTAAFTSLFNYIGINHIAVGVIDKIEYLENVSVNAVSVQLKSRWNGHQAGQFAFITFDNDEGAHPFTISSAWQNDGKLRFLVKALGDYTKTLASTLKHDALVKVEGPYGCFDFNGKMQRQIWISGGVGITPFIARMELLALQPDGRSIDFFHSSKVFRDEEFDRLSELAKTAGVNLHLIISARDGELTSEKIRAKVFDWKSADIWFCGPASFGKAILTSLLAEGLTANQFHQELFEMR